METIAFPMALRRPAGFTLIEVLLVIVIMGVLLSLAAPSFVTFTASQKVKTASFELYAAMMFARSEALKRKAPVTVAANGGNWASGWTVTVGGTTLRTQDSLSGIITASPDTSVVYRQDGRLSNAGVVGVQIQPQSADASISNRCLRVDLTGLPKTTILTGSMTCP